MKCKDFLNALAKNPDKEVTIWMTNMCRKKSNHQPKQESLLYGEVDIAISGEFEDRDYVNIMFYN